MQNLIIFIVFFILIFYIFYTLNENDSNEHYLNNLELRILASHINYWLLRGPFIQQKVGFQKLEHLQDPYLINFFKNKLNDTNVIKLYDNYKIVFDPKMSTHIFRTTIPNFPPGILETNLSSTLAPTQTTLSMGNEWIKRRCLSEQAMEWKELGSIVMLQPSKHKCPVHNNSHYNTDRLTAIDVAVNRIDDWQGSNYSKLAMSIVFGSDDQTDRFVSYIEKAQTVPSLLDLPYIPSTDEIKWYREFLNKHVSNPNDNSLAKVFINTAKKSKYKYTDQEIEDQLSFAFFQINGIFNIILPIALLIADKHKESKTKLADVKKKNLFYDNNYLHYFIMEILRLYNPVFILQRTVGKNIKIHNYQFKKGDQLSFPFASFMRNNYIYPQPDKFNPMRWKKEAAIDWQEGQHPFSSGNRTCPGRILALNILKYSIFKSSPKVKYNGDVKLDFNNMPQSINPFDISFNL